MQRKHFPSHKKALVHDLLLHTRFRLSTTQTTIFRAAVISLNYKTPNHWVFRAYETLIRNDSCAPTNYWYSMHMREEIPEGTTKRIDSPCARNSPQSQIDLSRHRAAIRQKEISLFTLYRQILQENGKPLGRDTTHTYTEMLYIHYGCIGLLLSKNRPNQTPQEKPGSPDNKYLKQ